MLGGRPKQRDHDEGKLEEIEEECEHEHEGVDENQETDLTAGQDTALKAALAWVRNKAALPTRFQPMSTFSGSR